YGPEADFNTGNAHLTAVSLRSDDPGSADVLLSLNCRGSSACGIICRAEIETLKGYVDKIGDNDEYSNGDQVACQMCPHCGTPEQTPDCPFPIDMGICVFPQNMKKDEKVKGSVIKEKVNRIIQHGCKKCGSCPIQPGNDVKTGEVTINYTINGCGEGKCNRSKEGMRKMEEYEVAE
ncbi:hypothetical protein N0V95_000946, partial [Ascochyta clinopodiicola]